MGKKITTESFIERSKKVHGDTYLYTKTDFKKSSDKVCITCKKHGDFWQLPFSHLNGCGCPKCGNIKKNTNKKMSVKDVIERAKKVHGNKYSYDKTVYDGIYKKICIICPKHGEFWQTPKDHFDGCGCPKCSVDSVWDSRGRITTEDFIKEAKKIHGNKYDYSEVEYKNRRKKIKIICHRKNKNGVEHGSFFQTPGSHLNGCGCPHCRNSRLENKVFNLLTKNNIVFEKEKTYDWLINNGHMYLDFYLPYYNAAIECQGVQHYVNIKIRGIDRYEEINNNDLLKRELCYKHGVKIFYFTDKNMYENYCENKESTYYDFDSMINDIKNECTS